MARRSGLGKGLSALIPGEVVGEPDSALRVVPISHIRPNAYQPRSHFDEESMASLAASIRAVGLLQPVLVRELQDETESYELIAGERRWRAARRAGLQTIPVLGPGGRRRRQPRAGAGREPPPGGPQRPRGGGGLPAADRRVRPHPRAGGQPDGQGPGHGDQHAAAVAAAGRGPAGARRGLDLGRARPGSARDARTGRCRRSWSSASSRRA